MKKIITIILLFSFINVFSFRRAFQKLAAMSAPHVLYFPILGMSVWGTYKLAKSGQLRTSSGCPIFVGK